MSINKGVLEPPMQFLFETFIAVLGNEDDYVDDYVDVSTLMLKITNYH